MKSVMKSKTLELAYSLSNISVKNWANPFPNLDTWKESIDPKNAWHFKPELISIHGTDIYEALNEDARKTLAFYEAINFYSLNVHGERSLMEGLAHRLYRKWPEVISTYIHHFLSEENNHMVYFGHFCEKYAGRVYPDRHIVVARDYEKGEEDFLFFARVLIFEEIVDYYNYHNSKDETLDPVAREINRSHRFDESRHIAFGRRIVSDLYEEYSQQWGEQKRKEISEYLNNYTIATLKEYYSPDAYADAGLKEPFKIVMDAWEQSECRERRKAVSAKVLQFFKTHNVTYEDAEL